MLRKFVKLFGGDPNKKEIEKLGEMVARINAMEAEYEALSDSELQHKTVEFKERIAKALVGLEDENEIIQAQADVLDEILLDAFATVREASKRTLGQRPYDVQLIGATVLHRGQIAEMRTGEGKTLVATLPVYLNALTGKGVHLITVNDYLARRDARWMAQVYHFLGLSVGILQMASATENGKKAFLYDPDRGSAREDQDKLRLVDRKLAYDADVVYGTNSEFGFDYLRDNMTMNMADRVQRGHHYAIVDEVDNVLIDEARTPLIISGPASGDVEWYGRMAQLVRQLKIEDYEVSEKDRSISLTEIGTVHVEQLLGQPLRDPERPEEVTPEQARLLGYLEQALRAQFLFHRNKDYLVQGGKVIIVDEFTGRLMPGRRWSDGLHQAVEAKEGVRVEPENITYATITLQNYFRMYKKLSGMTGTALTEAEEFSEIYKLEVLPIPTNLEYQVANASTDLVEVHAQDEYNYKYTCYARSDDPESMPVFWKRKDYPDVIYRTSEAKLRSIVHEIISFHIQGRPLLVGTTSVEGSDRLSNRLRADPVRRLLQVYLGRHSWLKANDRVEDGRLIAELAEFNKPLEKIQPNDLRALYRDLGLSLNLEETANINLLIEFMGLSPTDEPRLKAVIQGGVSHQVLNARKHTEESQVIAGAGAFGSVTIATNMAGRGVDIKLGGEIAEEILMIVNRVLRKAGYDEPYEMSLEERRQKLLMLDPASFGIYETEIKYFLQYFEDMEKVRSLGGLHVIGSERHESRRIDNQLRGRAARQGDPGSSRFYLSLEDDLMRMFGGEQVKNMMERLHIDDAYPLEHRMVTGIIEQSQNRVEGANFDVRKHLLEYDDVLNTQRMRIYSQRDRVFEKEDLSDDVNELLVSEIQHRVPPAFQDDEGPWRLLAWLDQIQPFITSPDGIYPTFSYRLLLDELEHSGQDLRVSVLEMARKAIELEHEHILIATRDLADRTGESLEKQVNERTEILDTFFEATGENNEETPRRAQEMLDEISGLARMPIRLTSEQMRTLAEDPRELQETILDQVANFITGITITRFLGAIENRLAEPLELDRSGLQGQDWDEIVYQVMQAVQAVLEKRMDALVGQNGQVVRDLETILQRSETWDDGSRIRLLNSIAQGRKTIFDNKTHRQVQQVTVRFSIIYLAAKLLAEIEPDEVMDEVLGHLEQARDVIRRTWGETDWARLTQNMNNIPRLVDLPQIAAVVSLPNGGDIPEDHLNLPLPELNEDDRLAVVLELGKRTQTQIYRQVLLGAITELWVDYLTKVESLRIAIGLEAYAQRDPLVQYKGQASQLFQSLLGDIRSAVISRIFLYTPRIQSASQPEINSETSSESKVADVPRKKKRRRH